MRQLNPLNPRAGERILTWADRILYLAIFAFLILWLLGIDTAPVELKTGGFAEHVERAEKRLLHMVR